MNGLRLVLVVVAVAAVLFSDSPIRFVVVVALAPSSAGPQPHGGGRHQHTLSSSAQRRSSSSSIPQPPRRGAQFSSGSSSVHQWPLNSKNQSSAHDQKAAKSFQDLVLDQQLLVVPHNWKDPQLRHHHDSTPIATANSETKRMSSPGIMMMTMLTSWSMLGFLLFIPEAAQAATTHAAPVPNALVAYAHFAGLLVCAGLLTYERTTVQAGMTAAQEKNLVLADAAYGITALVVGGSGITRVLEYGKGWDYYSHEPIFWLKLTFVGLWASLSLFPTITLVRRGIPLFQDRPDEVEPMSAALARRLQQIITAELSALVTIPLTATLMARGVGYSNDFPWPVGAALVTLVTGGSAFVYAKQALTWTEEEPEKDNNSNS